MKRLYLLFFCLAIIVNGIHAQGDLKRKKPANFNKKKPSLDNESYIEKQWWLGFKAGTNLSKAVVTKTYSVISPSNYDVADISKQYTSFKKMGFQAGIEITFFYKGISISTQPTYKTIILEYSNHYAWSDAENPNNYLELNYQHKQNLEYLDVPLLIKYNLLNRKLKPYVQVGGYMSFLLDATKSLTVSGLDRASGGENTFQNEPVIVGAKDLFAGNHWGLLGGVGVNYNLGNVRLNLDVQYKLGMSNISSAKQRNSSDRLSGMGDSLDDMTLSSLQFNLGCLFPLRFLTSGYKSVDK